MTNLMDCQLNTLNVALMSCACTYPIIALFFCSGAWLCIIWFRIRKGRNVSRFESNNYRGNPL